MMVNRRRRKSTSDKAQKGRGFAQMLDRVPKKLADRSKYTGDGRRK